MPKRRLNSLSILSFGMLVALSVLFAPTSSRAETMNGEGTVIHGTAIPYEAENKAALPASEKDVAGKTRADKAAAPAEEEENIGFPQLNAKTYPSQVFWLFCAFVTLYVLMSKIALPRVGEVLDARRTHKESDLKRAQQMQEEATKVKTAYEAAIAKAQAEAAEAQAAAEQEVSEKIAAEVAKFAEAARKRVATAEQAIARAKDEAVSSLADISADVAMDMANKVAGVQVGKAEARSAVAKVMKEAA
jgi:F-type H+-transporting ATPase subunit b